MIKHYTSSEKWIIAIIFILGLFSSLVFISNQIIVQDSIQLLERGHLFSQGILVPFGPRSTNTNFIYGPFISVFVGTLLWFWSHPFSPMLGILGLHILCFFLLFKIEFLQTKKTFFLTFLFIFWVSPWRSSEVFLWNPSFLFPLMILYLFGVDLCLRQNNFWGTLCMGIATVLTLQVHNSVLFLVILSVLLVLRKSIKLDLKALALTAIIGAVCLAPTLYIIMRNPEVLSMNKNPAPLFRNLLRGGEAIKGLTYWLRYPSLYFGSTTFQLPKINWMTSDLGDRAWWIMKWVVAVLSVVVVLVANFHFFKDKKKGFLRSLCLMGMASLFFVSILSPVSFNFWHLYLVFPLTLIPLVHYISEKQHLRRYLIPLGMYFLFYSYLGAMDSYKHNDSADQSKAFGKIKGRSEAIEQEFRGLSIDY
jgi:hypothetical protein